MNISIKTLSQNPLVRLRRLGYVPYQNRQGKDSFVKRLQGDEFPRFHLYVQQETDSFIHCSLHIDQTAQTHSKKSAHKGEYNSQVVKTEARRLEA